MKKNIKVKYNKHKEKVFEGTRIFTTWNKYLMLCLGLWPSKNNNLIFIVLFSYLCCQIILNYVTIYYAIRSFNQIKVVSTTIEVLTLLQIFVRLYTIKKYNFYYGQIFEKFYKDFFIQQYKNEKEKTVFLAYNLRSKLFIKIVASSLGLTATIYFIKPLIQQLNFSNNTNSTMNFAYDVPYRMYTFVKITNTKIYILTYILQAPLFYIIIFTQIGMDCLTLTLLSHLCGQLAVLSIRISNLNLMNGAEELKKIIKKHNQLLKIGIKLKEIYRICLFTHFIGASVGICILVYKILLSISLGQKTNFVTFFSYGFLNIFRLYIHCWLGESLIHESINVSKAFYECQWYNLLVKDQKSILICITRSQTPLLLIAGNFGNYSLTMFTNVMKSAMAYLSFLRNFI